MHRSEVDYSTLARAEAAAQQDSTSGQVGGGGGDAPPGVLQRSRPLPSSSDAGHLALAAQQAGDGEGDGDGSSQGDWSVASTQRDSKESALEDFAGGCLGACTGYSTVLLYAPHPLLSPPPSPQCFPHSHCCSLHCMFEHDHVGPQFMLQEQQILCMVASVTGMLYSAHRHRFQS